MTVDKTSQHKQLVCLDIETVPDRALIPDWTEGMPPKPVWHRIVAISVVQAVISRQPNGVERYEVECCRTGGQADWTERQLLQRFWDYFSALDARVVTWNGKGFDLPTLKARSMVHGLSAASWFTRGTRWDNYTQRYAADWHCDLMEQLSDYRACSSMSLNDMAHAIGLPGKVGGHGAEVEAMLKAGQLDQVRAYCECDCLNLFALYARWALLSGRTDLDGHDASIRSLVACLERECKARPHMSEFLALWRANKGPAPTLLAPMSHAA